MTRTHQSAEKQPGGKPAMNQPPDQPQIQHPATAWRRETTNLVPPERSPVWTSDTLLGGQKAVAIEHNGALYRLQSTRAGKLILTK